MHAPDVEVSIRVTVVYSPQSRQHDICALDLPSCSSVAQAVAASGLLERHAVLRGFVDAGVLQVGVWGRRCSPQTRLAEGDRIELYRPLVVDPKEARRLRYRAQGERGRKARVRRTPNSGAAATPVTQA
jgi:putative ubiquitin-RnfH superfamily antitoxin RatB of RatAB toxin-antitoxin module